MREHRDVSFNGRDSLSSLNSVHRGFLKENIACYGFAAFFKIVF